MPETCRICGCEVHRSGGYAEPTVQGRSHATKHHYVAERFFGRSKNRAGTQREPIFTHCPWGCEGKTAGFCYECHEELLHNPVLTPAEVNAFCELVDQRGFDEMTKSEGKDKIAGRIRLFHEVIVAGLAALKRRTS